MEEIATPSGTSGEPTAGGAKGKPERLTVHVLWMTAGLGCDGESVAMTAATNPSIEDLLDGVIPDMPHIVLHNQMLAFEVGDEYMQAWYDAEDGGLDPFILVLEGAIGDESNNGDGHWTGFGVNPFDGQPISVNEWIDRLAPKAAAVVAVGTCATYGGVPAMRNNPTGAIGLPDYLGWSWRSRSGLPIVCIPGCPAQPDNMTSVLLELVLHLGGTAPAPVLDEQLRPRWLFDRTTREGCAGPASPSRASFATEYGNDSRCLVKLGCKGPMVKCNVPCRGWVNGDRRLPERRRHLHRLHDARLPRQVHAVHGRPTAGATRPRTSSASPTVRVFRYFRKRNLRIKFDRSRPGGGRPRRWRPATPRAGRPPCPDRARPTSSGASDDHPR